MTETKEVDGSTVVVTWTSTSTIVTKVKETQTVYTTAPPVTKSTGTGM